MVRSTRGGVQCNSRKEDTVLNVCADITVNRFTIILIATFIGRHSNSRFSRLRTTNVFEKR